MKIQGIDTAASIDPLHHPAPDAPNFRWISDAQAIKEHLVVWQARWDQQQLPFQVRPKRIGSARDGLKERQGFFKPTAQQRRTSIQIKHIVKDGIVTFIRQIKRGKDTPRCLGPSKVRIAKALMRNPHLLKDRYSLFRLLILLLL